MEQNVYGLALQLHMTVGEMTSKMSMPEFVNWLRYFKEQRLQEKRAYNKAHNIIDFTDPESVAQMSTMFKEKPNGNRNPSRAKDIDAGRQEGSGAPRR